MRTRTRWLRALWGALAISGLLLTGALATAHAQTFDPPPSGAGLHIAAFDGGSIEEAAAAVPNAVSLWVTVDGEFVGYIPGAPDFVNSPFLAEFPGGQIPQGTLMLIRVGDPTSPPPTATPTTSPTATQTPTEIPVIGLTSPVARNADATLTVDALGASTCSLSYWTPSGTLSEAEGLGTTAVTNGLATWTWTIGPSTLPGTGELLVTCGDVIRTLAIVIE